MIAGVWWWTSSFILEVWAETAALEGSDSREIYWLTSLFKCSMLALDSHNLIACAEKNAMPFSGELSCLCGRAVQEGLGSPQGCSSLSATTGNTWYLLYSYKVVFFFFKTGSPRYSQSCLCCHVGRDLFSDVNLCSSVSDKDLLIPAPFPKKWFCALHNPNVPC